MLFWFPREFVKYYLILVGALLIAALLPPVPREEVGLHLGSLGDILVYLVVPFPNVSLVGLPLFLVVVALANSASRLQKRWQLILLTSLVAPFHYGGVINATGDLQNWVVVLANLAYGAFLSRFPSMPKNERGRQLIRPLVTFGMFYLIGAGFQSVLFRVGPLPPSEAVLRYLVSLVVVVPLFLMAVAIVSSWPRPLATLGLIVAGCVMAVLSLYSWFPPLLVLVVVVSGIVAISATGAQRD